MVLEHQITLSHIKDSEFVLLAVVSYASAYSLQHYLVKMLMLEL